MIKAKFLISLALVVSILMVQVGGVFAAPATGDTVLITGRIHRITLDTNPNTGITTVIVELTGQGEGKHVVRLSQEVAIDLKLVALDVDGLVINDSALGGLVEIDPALIIPDQEQERHPVGNALAIFFSDIAGLDYETIMDAHSKGCGFGVITQALWLTSEIPEGSLADFEMLILARETGDYSAFKLEDGTAIKNWGQLRKAILEGKEVANLGSVMSNKDNNGNGNTNDPAQNQVNNKDKEKQKDKEKSKNESGNSDGGNKGNGNGNKK
ncbi:MAG TPA: hypothetical protein VK897_08970 [Anaerolineales bacterium]|nr:hypothetical protein [Anaerolineales bacterium]